MYVLLRQLRELRRTIALPPASARGSLALRHVDAGSCNGCEHELNAVANPYYGSAYDISEGQRLYQWYNCVGCHANGGGGMGPPLIKEEWIYGGEPPNIFDTIVKGRPNGMPTWGGRIPMM